MSPVLTLTVREHARLTTAALPANTLDEAQVPPSAFEWLCLLATAWRRSGARLLQVEDRQWLRLDNHVGVLESPCGVRLEILPKQVTHSHTDEVRQARATLRRLLASALDVSAREVGEADLAGFEHPLTEWVMRQFTLALERLVQRGVRSDYRRVEDEQPFLRGQLDAMRQLRQPPGRAQRFQIRHDVFDPDRPENRLLKRAVLRVLAHTQAPDTWRLANALSHRLAEVPPSADPAADARRWQTDRLMAHYQPVRPWCELVLGNEMPLALAGAQRGLSLLFPMERLFERHVAAVLRRRLPAPLRLATQSTRHSLCEHAGQRAFTLKPDLMIEGPDGPLAVLDTKWKRLDRHERLYGLAQADAYQLHAYGQVCLNGVGELALIYPRTEAFAQPPDAPFIFSPQLRLWLMSFDLNDDTLGMGAPAAAVWAPWLGPVSAEADPAVALG